jgi:chemotaxis protein CheD
VSATRALEEAAGPGLRDGGLGPQSARRPVLDGRARRSVQLFPGQIVASREPTLISTILGSCVAVCLFDPEQGIGGMNHFMLPHAPGSPHFSARFGAVACERLVEEIVVLGGERRNLIAKVFGGACVLESLRGSGAHLGQKNFEVASAVLARHGIPIAAHEIGGARGRKLVFVTDTGAAWVQEIVPVSDGT